MQAKIRIVIISLIFLSLSPPAKAQFQFLFQNELLGEKAPDFTLRTTLGRKVNMTKFRDGQNAIIFFWATWCPHCRVNLEAMNKIKDKIESQGIKMILVDLGEKEKPVRLYTNKKNIKYEIFLDEDERVSEAYNIIGVPTFFFVGKDGIVKSVDYSFPKNYAEIFSQSKF